MNKLVYQNWFDKLHEEPYAVGGIEGEETFLKLISKSKKKVLVIGCGEGHEVNWLVRHGFDAMGVTIGNEEAVIGRKKYGVDIRVRDMHDLGDLPKFDAIFAGKVLEHSPMPYLALLHWRKYLKKNGWLVLVMPSREWLPEHYHYSVMTRAQMKELLYKSGYVLLAGPQMKPKIDYQGGDVFRDLGRKWGFSDGYVAKLTDLSKEKFALGNVNEGPRKKGNIIVWAIRQVMKWPYNKIRVRYWRNYREW